MPIIAAVIGGVAAIGGGLISSHAANNASNRAAQAAASNNALQSQIYNSNKALITPYVDRGNTAADALQGFLGLGGDPAKTQAAFQNYLNSTGYQFNLHQGLDAAEQSKAAQGLYNSGAALKALQDRGTSEAQLFGQNYINNLNTVANRGVNAAGTLTGAGQTYAGAVGANNNSAASAAGNAGLVGAAQTNGLIGNALSAFGQIRGQSSYGGGGNAFASGGGNANPGIPGAG